MTHASPEIGESVAREGTIVEPVLREYLEQFQRCLTGISEATGEQRLRMARSLGATSRDIRFRLGPPEEAPPELVTDVLHLLQQAAEKRSEGDCREISLIFDHIRERAECILRQLSVRTKTWLAT